MIKPGERNTTSAFIEGETDKFPPVGRPNQEPEVAYDTSFLQNETDEECNGSSQGPVPSPFPCEPVLTLPGKVESARQAIRLVLEHGLEWRIQHEAPQALIDAQTMLIGVYQLLIDKWRATYHCARQVAEIYSVQPLEKAPTPAHQLAAGETMLVQQSA